MVNPPDYIVFAINLSYVLRRIIIYDIVKKEYHPYIRQGSFKKDLGRVLVAKNEE